jgi:hypothetical protein
MARKHTPEGRYLEHRDNARKRGIPFKLTFKQWFALWEESGKWKQRGNRTGQYCMARPGDKGAYEVGNVVIILNEDNRAERNKNYRLLGEDNPAFGKNYLATASKAAKKRRAAITKSTFTGTTQSEQHIARKLESFKRTIALRKLNRTYV